ncbi:transmembrane protein 272-like [Tribolium madens]|uniref:transmembrane protein 272-like n=1 Tax=Tribolium madens TaxID=41895 RepID=UPI001CF72F92|nr:transmembrane protein 272-like [Tribolium madens]
MTEENITNEDAKYLNKNTRLKRLKEKCQGSLKFSFVFFSLIHVATIVIAATYYDKCTAEPDIPKYLLYLGILGLVTKLISLFKNFLIKHLSVSPILSFILTGELTLLIVGSYYVYREYEPNYDSDNGEPYCNKTLYLFAFIYMTVIYSLIFLIMLIVGCFVLSLLLLDKYVPPHDTEEDKMERVEIPIPTEQGTKAEIKE